MGFYNYSLYDDAIDGIFADFIYEQRALRIHLSLAYGYIVAARKYIKNI